MKFHKLADIFPMMNDEEFAGLKNDIAEHGLLDPIWTWQDEIIDGRNRYKACQELNIEPYYQEWDSKGSLIQFIISRNLHRRHLSESQRAMVAAKVANMPQGKRTDLEPSVNLHYVSAADSAKLLNVSRRGVFQAKKVLTEGTPELAEVVKQGKVAVSLAAKIIDWEKPQIETFLKSIEKGTRPAKAKEDIEKRERRKKHIAKSEDVLLATDTYKLIHGDFADVGPTLEPDSFDFIITDPPYGKEHIYLFGLLAKEAKRLLKPGGSLLAMSGQSYLPDYFELLGKYLKYQWTVCYLTPGGQAPMIRHRRVNAFWKPVLWYVKGEYTGDYRGDVVKSAVNDNDKRFHDWGQSLSGISELIEKYTMPGNIILDPFVGGGTIAEVCIRLGRKFVGIDVDYEQIQITLGRLKGL